MTTITTEQQQAIATVLAPMILSKGLGTAENACSIAAINLALTGLFIDEIPDCMSEVIGKWIIGVQDAMPAEMRNSAEWKRLLPLAAGTGRKREKERFEIILSWMWDTVLPTLQPIADKHGFGEEWRMMLQQRTADAAAAYAAYAADYAANAAYAANVAANSAYAANSACTAYAAAYVAAYAAAASSTAAAASNAAAAAANAAYAAADAADAAANAAADYAAAWQQFNPCGLLQRLISPSH